MSSRGSFAVNGHASATEYETLQVLESGVKILVGVGNNHSLPEFSHSPNSIYAKVREDGSLHTLRFFDSLGFLFLEIAYHPERNLDASGKKVLHYHLINGLNRDEAKLLTKKLKQKYEKILKEFDLYDKC